MWQRRSPWSSRGFSCSCPCGAWSPGPGSWSTSPWWTPPWTQSPSPPDKSSSFVHQTSHYVFTISGWTWYCRIIWPAWSTWWTCRCLKACRRGPWQRSWPWSWWWWSTRREANLPGSTQMHIDESFWTFIFSKTNWCLTFCQNVNGSFKLWLMLRPLQVVDSNMILSIDQTPFSCLPKLNSKSKPKLKTKLWEAFFFAFCNFNFPNFLTSHVMSFRTGLVGVKRKRLVGPLSSGSSFFFLPIPEFCMIIISYNFWIIVKKNEIGSILIFRMCEFYS